MRLLRTSVLLAVTLAVAGVAAQTAGGQSSAPAAAKDAPAAKKSTMPRTSWGKPDLEGTWDFRTVTPMERTAEGPEDRSTAERCIMGFNSGPPMAPGGYNQNVQIIEHPNYVVLLNEMIHNARIIPLDERPRLNVPQWVGESRGHWEADTLVIETTNFHQNTSLRGSSPKLHLVERLRRVDADSLLYEFTVDDPTTW